MDIETQKIVLNDFLRSLHETRGVSVNPVSAVVTDSVNSLSDMIDQDRSENVSFLQIAPNVDLKIFFSSLAEALQTKEYVFLTIDSEIPQTIYNELVRLSKEGFFDVALPEHDERLVERIQKNSNVILAGERQTLQDQQEDLLNLVNQFVILK